MSFWIAHTTATGLAVALETETPCPTLCIAAGCRCLHSIPDNALQGESTRRFDFRNTADTPKMIDTLRLDLTFSPSPCTPLFLGYPGYPGVPGYWLVARTTPSCNVAAPFRSCPYHNHQLALFLPRFYPAFTLMAPINPFYPVFTPVLPRSGG